MAVINLTLDEILKIAESNVKLPKQIKDVQAEGDTIILTIDPGRFIPGFKTSIKYDSFNDGIVFFKIQANPLMKLLINFIDSNYNDKININQDVISLKLNFIISEHVKAVKVTKIVYSSDMFSIYINSF